MAHAKPYSNIYLTEGLSLRIRELAKLNHRSQSKQILYLLEIGLGLDRVPVEWETDSLGRQRPTSRPAGTTISAGQRAFFRAPEPIWVEVDNFRHDNDLKSFSEAIRVLLTAALRELDTHGCCYCQGSHVLPS